MPNTGQALRIGSRNQNLGEDMGKGIPREHPRGIVQLVRDGLELQG